MGISLALPQYRYLSDLGIDLQHPEMPNNLMKLSLYAEQARDRAVRMAENA